MSSIICLIYNFKIISQTSKYILIMYQLCKKLKNPKILYIKYGGIYNYGEFHKNIKVCISPQVQTLSKIGGGLCPRDFDVIHACEG